MFGTFKRLAAGLLVAGLALASAVSGHGYLAEPAARNVQLNSGYCPQCLNAGGTWKVFEHGLPGRYGVCGDAWDEPKTHESPVRLAGRYRAGDTIAVRVVITANHLGRWGLKLCPRATRLDQDCFDAHPLRKPNGKRWTRVREGKDAYEKEYVVPDDVECEACVLQWTYETANSCNLRGSPHIEGLPDCHESANWERFWNCADVKIDRS